MANVSAGAGAVPTGEAGPGPSTIASRAAAQARIQSSDDAEASLRKRMAGPSSGKAGLSADQEEINRKIYEASRGSKFFENERLKDAETTQRINALLAKRDDALSRVPVDSPEWNAIGRKVDLRLAELEETRDLSRQICHIDADMFYAAVELKRDPSLKGKAFGVGSGVLTTASYEARQKGCRSGQAVFVAKALCPELIVVPNDFKAYVQASGEVMEILGSYDENLQPASLDEAYLDITEYCTQHQMTAEQVVTQMRKEIQDNTGLTVSVGIAANKTLAKICSDKNKPNGQYELSHEREAIMQFMANLPVRKIPGIGRVTERILSAVNVNTCGDIWEHRHELYLTFGNSLDQLLSAYLGLGSTHVRPNDRRERKSVGRETTFRPTSDMELLKEELRGCADQVEIDLERNHFKGRTVTLVAKKDTFQRFTRARSGTTFLHKADDLYNITVSLLLAEGADFERQHPGLKLTLRLIGVRVTQLKDLEPPDNQIKKLFEAAEGRNSGQRPPRRQATDDEEDEELKEALRLSLLQSRKDSILNEDELIPADIDVTAPTLEADEEGRQQDGLDSPRKAVLREVTRTPQKRSSVDRLGPQVCSSSFSPPRPKQPEKLQAIQFDKRPPKASASDLASTPASDVKKEGQLASSARPAGSGSGTAIARSATCPICQQDIKYWSNQELNRQIDDCMEGRGHSVETARSEGRGKSSPSEESMVLPDTVDASAKRKARLSTSSGKEGDGGTKEKKAGRSSSAAGGPLDMWLNKRRRTDASSN
ncbi:hypothetical protein OC845_002920 [Tilletia horrida]|nr:hypothetical protein OC845_002920 [Tilletia horrida]